MRNFFQKLLSSTPQREATRVPVGQRVYAVGDIHGYAKLFWDPISADCDAILRYLVKLALSREGPYHTCLYS